MSVFDNKDVTGGDLLKVCVGLGIKVHHISVPILLCSQLRRQHLQKEKFIMEQTQMVTKCQITKSTATKRALPLEGP